MLVFIVGCPFLKHFKIYGVSLKKKKILNVKLKCVKFNLNKYKKFLIVIQSLILKFKNVYNN